MSVRIEVDGLAYEQWTGMSLNMGVTNFAPSFALDLFDEWSREKQEWPIREDQVVQLFIQDELYITGMIQRVDSMISPDDLQLSVQGQSYTADLLTGHPFTKNVTWAAETRLSTVLNDILEGYSVQADFSQDPELAGLVIKTKLGIDRRDPIVEILERLAYKYSLLFLANQHGEMVVLRSQALAESSAYGEVRMLTDRPLRRGYSGDATKRFSRYTVLAANTSRQGTQARQAVLGQNAVYDDPGTARPKHKIILAGADTDVATLRLSARYHAAVAAGQSQKVRIEQLGVLDVNGLPIRPGNLVAVSEPYYRRDPAGEGLLLVDTMNVRLSAEDGLVSTLQLVNPNTYGTEYVEPL